MPLLPVHRERSDGGADRQATDGGTNRGRAVAARSEWTNALSGCLKTTRQYRGDEDTVLAVDTEMADRSCDRALAARYLSDARAFARFATAFTGPPSRIVVRRPARRRGSTRLDRWRTPRDSDHLSVRTRLFKPGGIQRGCIAPRTCAADACAIAADRTDSLSLKGIGGPVEIHQVTDPQPIHRLSNSTAPTDALYRRRKPACAPTDKGGAAIFLILGQVAALMTPRGHSTS